MRIGSRQITRNAPPYVIAEIGVNHDGSCEKALELIHAARDAGADAVKVQMFRAELLLSRAARLARYQHLAGEIDPVSMLRRLELPPDRLGLLATAAHDLGLHAIVTVFSLELVPEAAAMPWDAFKSASPDIIHRPLLGALTDTNLPLIISTGAATIDEVTRAIAWLHTVRDRLAILQCVSSYPTPPPLASIGAIRHLQSVFPGPVGYSDHTREIDTGALAVANGACILEKHLTLDTRAPGPDHAASLMPDQMREYIRLARAAGAGALAAPDDPRIGDTRKQVLECERDVRTTARQSLTTTRPLAAGHRLRPGDLTCKRPGLGLEPFRIDDVLGRPLSHTVEADMPLLPEHLA